MLRSNLKFSKTDIVRNKFPEKIEAMKKLHLIFPSFRLGFDLICVIFAGFYTLQQVFTYIKNEDVSEIAFRKFNDDDSSQNYPTYTICFEDQSQHHIYRTEPIATVPESSRIVQERCPCGCYAKKEGNRLFLLNHSCKDQGNLEPHQLWENDFQLIPTLFDEQEKMN